MQIDVRENLKHLLKANDLLRYPAVAVGTAEGLFDRDILNWGVSMLYSVDSWQEIPNQKGDGGSPQSWHDANFENAKKLLSSFKERSVIIKDFSLEASKRFSDNSIGFIYLDADHSYRGVMSDLQAWFPKLVTNGIISGHDFLNPSYGVYTAVTEFTTKIITAKVELIPDIDLEHAGFWFQKK